MTSCNGPVCSLQTDGTFSLLLISGVFAGCLISICDQSAAPRQCFPHVLELVMRSSASGCVCGSKVYLGSRCTVIARHSFLIILGTTCCDYQFTSGAVSSDKSWVRFVMPNRLVVCTAAHNKLFVIYIYNLANTASSVLTLDERNVQMTVKE